MTDAPPPRLLPEKPLPPYAYVTGHFPHPLRDPSGHSYARPIATVSWNGPDNWHAYEPYLWGIELFNFGYYWEAHEAWEAMWHATGREGPHADFFKALIKLAAAGVKAREGRPNGVRRHAHAAMQLVQEIAPFLGGIEARHMGLSLRILGEQAQWLAERADEVVDTQPARVKAVLPLVLRMDRQ